MSALRELFAFATKLVHWWIVVSPWEQALRVRLGKHVLVLHAGVHFKIPFIDKLYLRNIRMRWTRLLEQDLSTTDGRVITLQGLLGYSIVDISKLFNTLHHAEATIQGEAMRHISSFIHSHPLEECNPASLESFLSKALDLEQFGLGDIRLSITDFTVVKTYRFLTGSDRYLPGSGLSTASEDSGGLDY